MIHNLIIMVYIFNSIYMYTLFIYLFIFFHIIIAKKLATCSSDRTIKIFDAVNGHELATLTSHEGPVWQVAWAHPKFGTLLASCSYDGAVIIHKQHDSGQAANSWSKIYEHKRHKSSVNSISWAPHEHGNIHIIYD